jgi:glyoxylase-like metal-dependent hydrolase (beta-lactamase superfamily II)
VLTTHGHWDHIQAVTALRDAGIDVGIADADAAMLPGYDFLIPDDTVIEVGDLRIKTILNPGHTPGSTSFLLEGRPVLFTGDTLFPGGAGNTQSAEGDFDQIIESTTPASFRRPRPARDAATASTPPSAPSAPTSEYDWLVNLGRCTFGGHRVSS